MNIADPVRRHAVLSPAREALVEPQTGRRVTFGELDDRSSALATALLERLHLSPGARVAVLAKNCIEYFEIYLACAKAGCIAHGLNWRFATPAMREALEDSQPTLIIVQDQFTEEALRLQKDIDATWCFFGPNSDESYDKLISSGLGHAPQPFLGEADDPLMIVYTGGTTGTSKGALHSHASVRAAMANNTIAERILPTDRYMLIGQAFHSAVVLALNYLSHGCPVVVLDFDPRAALEAVEEYQVTAFLGFPTMLTYMLQEGRSGGFQLNSLRNIQYGGGMFHEDTIFGLLDTFPCTLIQCYGTTESVGITFLTQEDHHIARTARPDLLRSIGAPAFLNDVQLSYDQQHAQFEGHQVGEVLVRSPSNMLGYWSQDCLTNPPARPKWLPTGDLAFNNNGYLYLVGRSKDVIISGGENIYAGQVENAIQKHSAVLEVAVIGIADEHWGEAVKAVVALRPGQHASEQDIKACVQAELASYQKPKVVEFVDELPRTPTGKIRKQALR